MLFKIRFIHLIATLLLAISNQGYSSQKHPPNDLVISAVRSQNKAHLFWVALRSGKTQDGITAHLFSYNAENRKSSSISLPSSLAKREIIGILPSAEQRLLLFSQHIIEDGDAVQVHELSLQNNKAQKVLTIPCILPEQVLIESKSFTTYCADEADEKKSIKILSSNSSKTFAQSLKISFPQNEASSDQWALSFDPLAAQVDQLKILKVETHSSLTASKLFQ